MVVAELVELRTMQVAPTTVPSLSARLGMDTEEKGSLGPTRLPVHNYAIVAHPQHFLPRAKLHLCRP